MLNELADRQQTVSGEKHEPSHGIDENGQSGGGRRSHDAP
jgi:hypothetical protein